jgi:uncharacterized membrane protein
MCLRFMIGPMIFVGGTLVVRIAIHFSYWNIYPIFFVAGFAAAAIALWAGLLFAAEGDGWWVPARMFVWVIATVVVTLVGLFLVALLPISVGDGP